MSMTMTKREYQKRADRFHEAITEELNTILYNLEDSELIEMWNTFCRHINHEEKIVYRYEELDDICQDMTPIQIIESYGHLNGCSYFTEDVYTESFNDLKFALDIEELVCYMVDNEMSFFNDECREAIEYYMSCMANLNDYFNEHGEVEE